MQSIRIAIMDRNDLSRHGLQALVEKLAPAVRLVGVYTSLTALEEGLRGREVDVLLLDDLLPQTLSIHTVVTRLHAFCPSLQILVVSQNLSMGYIQDLLQNEVRGFIYKEERFSDILNHAIHVVHARQPYLSPQASVLPYNGTLISPHPKLKTRDLNVLYLMHEGKTVQEIAMKLYVSDRMVYESQAKLRRALGVPTTELIVAAALKKGWLKGMDLPKSAER
jgi:two-component system invasion response regulator UvrY